MPRTPIDLTPAGPDWQDWYLGPYGRANSYRLITPTGEILTPREIAAARRDALNYGYLESRYRAVQHELERLKEWCSQDNADHIRAVFALIETILPESTHGSGNRHRHGNGLRNFDHSIAPAGNAAMTAADNPSPQRSGIVSKEENE